jgi:uncharacterized membrane protein
LRDHNGTISTIDYPNTNNGTFPYAINSDGKIIGNYFNGNQYSGFLRNRNGKYITFDPPGSTITTTPTAVNPEGEITGWYYGSDGVQHGFLRPAQPDE